MTDEQFMRQWNEGHTAFSADIDRKIALLADRLSSRERAFFGIGDTYDGGAARRLHPILSGLAACLSTTLLFLSAAALAIPGPVFTPLA